MTPTLEQISLEFFKIPETEYEVSSFFDICKDWYLFSLYKHKKFLTAIGVPCSDFELCSTRSERQQIINKALLSCIASVERITHPLARIKTQFYLARKYWVRNGFVPKLALVNSAFANMLCNEYPTRYNQRGDGSFACSLYGISLILEKRLPSYFEFLNSEKTNDSNA